MVKKPRLLDDDTTLILSLDIQTVALLEVFDVVSQGIQRNTLLRCIHKTSTSLKKNVIVSANLLGKITRKSGKRKLTANAPIVAK